jgi:LmbE family N-acetylglucosaminyl deacetylase
VATVVFLHAHPDDETMLTGGTMAALADSGHRVVLVVATGGELGEVPGDLAPGESLADRRRGELERSAAVLGVARIAWLGHHDSGMAGWAENDAAGAFAGVPVEAAAAPLAALLRAEGAGVLVTYDEYGNYGHPDHVQAHRVGRAAAALAGTPVLYEATVNRDHLQRGMQQLVEAGLVTLPGQDDRRPDGEAAVDGPDAIGVPEALLTTAIDVAPWVARKRAALACHASQVTDVGFFLSLPEPHFTEAFGREWFIRVGEPAGIHESELAGAPLRR